MQMHMLHHAKLKKINICKINTLIHAMHSEDDQRSIRLQLHRLAIETSTIPIT